MCTGTEEYIWGYPSIESLVFGFIQVSHLVPKESALYSDVKQLAEGKRRLFDLSDIDASPPMKSHNLPSLLVELEHILGKEWTSPAIASDVRHRLSQIMSGYARYYVVEISAAGLKKSDVLSHLKVFYFGQRIAVTLAWLEQKWGVGFLRKFLEEPTSDKLVGKYLRWIRKVEQLSAATAAKRAGVENVEEFSKTMYRWENGKQDPRKDSFPLIRKAYGMESNPAYGLWFWIALFLDNCGDDELKQGVAAGVGKGFDNDSARAAFIDRSNQSILDTEVPESYLTLNTLLCTQVAREEGDFELIQRCLEEFEEYVSKHEGRGLYHLYSFQARMAVFTGRPKDAVGLFMKAIDLARYAEHVAAGKFFRAFAALCTREKYVVPLKYVADKQWLFGMHPVQKNEPDIWIGETEELLTNRKRAFDYLRYFAPQSFFKPRVIVLQAE